MADENSGSSNGSKFKTYISPKDFIPEFTLKAIILGAVFGIIFGAATVYLGLKVGLTVSASIPIAVLAISIFSKIGKSTILENNIVQTIGSAGESVAAGVVFTIPALIFLPGGGNYFNYLQVFLLALVGGILGVLFMIPLRRSLIVKEHGNLPYPEGTACADVLIAGEKGGSLARLVYYGLGLAFLYKLLMSVIGLWKDVPTYVFSRKSDLPNGTINGEITPELLGVGYIIGPKIAGIMVAGGVLSWLVLIPLITLIGDNMNTVFLPATKLISQMSASEIWSNYIRYIGAGAVTFGGIVTLIRSFPTIISAFRESFKDLKENKAGGKQERIRTERDIPLVFVLAGSVLLVIFMAVIPSIPTNLLSSVLIIIFGFFFVTVSSRIVGLIGASSNPISGMTIATLMATALIFVGVGWTGDFYQPVALVVGSIVCIAAAIAGATSQDLKTGYIIGATPVKQQIGFAAVMELSGVRSLPFAVGAYLPLSVSSPIFIGGLIKLIVDKKKKKKDEESEIGPGALFSSGLIAGGALTGIMIAGLMGTMVGTNAAGDEISILDKIHLFFLNIFPGNTEGAASIVEYLEESVLFGGVDLYSAVIFFILAAILFKFAMAKNSNGN
jgi:putative OPT family oligopeptide transporter